MQSNRADGPGVQPVWTGQWWHHRGDSIPGGCQVELWRRGKTFKHCPPSYKASTYFTQVHAGCNSPIKLSTTLLWFSFITPCFIIRIATAQTSNDGVCHVPKVRCLFVLSGQNYTQLCSSCFPSRHNKWWQNKPSISKLGFSNAPLCSTRAPILRDSVLQPLKLLWRPTNRGLMSLRSCSKTCRNQRDS